MKSKDWGDKMIHNLVFHYYVIAINVVSQRGGGGGAR